MVLIINVEDPRLAPVVDKVMKGTAALNTGMARAAEPVKKFGRKVLRVPDLPGEQT
jgi:hypothetical protein